MSAQNTQSSGDLLRDRDGLIDSNNPPSSTQNQFPTQPSQDQSKSLSALQPVDNSEDDLEDPNGVQTNVTAPLSAQQDVTTGEIPEQAADSLDEQHAVQTKAALKKKPSSKSSVNQRKTPSSRIASTPDRAKRELEEPVMRERKNPYANLPALRDLYQQLQASDQEPTRFGIEAFRTRTQSANADSQPKQSHPEDLQPKAGFPDDPSPELPIDSQYVLGPGDQLVLDLWGGISQRLSRTVDHEGRIALPEAGTVVLAGKSLADAQRLVETVLARQFRNIHAELSLAHVRSVRVYVVGEVERPGAYDLSSVSTALNALFAAGGPTARGSMRRLRHYRGTKLVEEIDLYDFLLLGVRQDTLRFESGDTLQVPLVGPQVTVAGTVKRPAIYELHDETQLAQVIQLAGGLRNIANLKQISLERIEAHQRHSMLNFGFTPDS
ncbi:MAG TPA: SLBB domain-containing protein, partial [candidate division Zixibacteria bacterium]|nr:SLBB domain-containing protein [candidate division Zixibacteria bacterium]